jgi:hypothetical protein
MHVVIFVVSSRRNKTNPHHGNKYIPVLNATHLQAFKPKRFTYDQLLKLINKMLAKMYVRKLKHFQPHSLLCQLWCLYITICSFFMWYRIWSSRKLTKQLRQTLFLDHIQQFHTANTLHWNRHTSRTIASSQHHPRERRPFLGQPSQCKKPYIGFARYNIVVLLRKKDVNHFAGSFRMNQQNRFLSFLSICIYTAE